MRRKNRVLVVEEDLGYLSCLRRGKKSDPGSQYSEILRNWSALNKRHPSSATYLI